MTIHDEIHDTSATADFLAELARVFRETPRLLMSEFDQGLLNAVANMTPETASGFASRNVLISIDPTVMRECGVSLQTTPLMADDPARGNASTAVLIFTLGGVGHCCRIADSAGKETALLDGAGATVVIEAHGDWPANGLVDCIVELGERLKPLAMIPTTASW